MWTHGEIWTWELGAVQSIRLPSVRHTPREEVISPLMGGWGGAFACFWRALLILTRPPVAGKQASNDPVTKCQTHTSATSEPAVTPRLTGGITHVHGHAAVRCLTKTQP